MPDTTKTVDLDLDRPIWGAAAFAEILNRSERQVHHLLRLRLLDADKIGHIWASTPRRLLKKIAGPGE